MKKILKITGIVFASFIGLGIIGAITGNKEAKESLTREKSLEKISTENGVTTYGMTFDVQNSDETVESVQFTITDSIMNVKKLDEKKVVKIFEDAARYAKFGAKNYLTFKISSFGHISIDSDGILYGSIMGEAKNSFGVPGSVLSIIPFNEKLEVDLSNVHGI
jgi:hypothetical protein